MIATRLACLTLICLLLGQLDTSVADCQYRIRTVTGNMQGAGTDADVFIELYGTAANCLNKKLDTPANDFNEGSTDYFTITCPCLGCIEKIKIKLLNASPSMDWYLVEIGVKKLPSSAPDQTFSSNAWLASGTKWLTSSETPYMIRVYTKNGIFAGTNAKVQIALQNQKSSFLITLNGGFGPGSVATFFKSVVTMCPLKQVYIGHNNAGIGPAWNLDKIYVYNQATDMSYDCSCDCWLFKIWNFNMLFRTVPCQEQ